MRKLTLSMIAILAMVFSFSSCGESTPAIEVSAEMTEFMGMMKASSDATSAALAKFAANDEIKEDDMGMYKLEEPKVISKKDDCYTAEFKSGLTTRTYEICWTNGKISKIVSKGMK